MYEVSFTEVISAYGNPKNSFFLSVRGEGPPPVQQVSRENSVRSRRNHPIWHLRLSPSIDVWMDDGTDEGGQRDNTP